MTVPTPLANLIAATDLSAPARHAAERAARLAHEHHARLTLVHVPASTAVHDLQAWLGTDTPVPARLLDDSARRLAHLAGELRRQQPIEVDTVCRAGKVLDEVGQEAQARQADLVVLGARGEGFLRRLVMGSTSERLLRRTPCPLLVVRRSPREPYRRVLVAVDFSAWTTPLLTLAARVAPRAHLLLFHAWQVPFEEKLHFAGVDTATIERYRHRSRETALRQVHALAATAGLPAGRWEPVVVEGQPSQRLVEHETETDADLIVIGKQGRSAAEDLLLGSVTQHVLAEGVGDVLVSTARAA